MWLCQLAYLLPLQDFNRDLMLISKKPESCWLAMTGLQCELELTTSRDAIRQEGLVFVFLAVRPFSLSLPLCAQTPGWWCRLPFSKLQTERTGTNPLSGEELIMTGGIRPLPISLSFTLSVSVVCYTGCTALTQWTAGYCRLLKWHFCICPD